MNCIVIDLVHSKVSDDMAAVTDGAVMREVGVAREGAQSDNLPEQRLKLH